MIINGIEFDFSTLNANDVDRMLAAQTRQQERARTEGSRYTPESDYPAWQPRCWAMSRNSIPK